ncbi:FmdB family zinc ribbon protein [Calditrichota bacterium]
MPTYEYKCKKCGTRFEKFQNMTEEPIKKCPECNGTVHRLIGPGAGVIYKGSGFYSNDYKHQTRCDNEQTCCGRNTRCDTPPCEK